MKGAKLQAIDAHRVMAVAFARTKHFEPREVYQLAEWLMEFTEAMGQALARQQEAYMDHLNVCISSNLIEATKKGLKCK